MNQAYNKVFPSIFFLITILTLSTLATHSQEIQEKKISGDFNKTSYTEFFNTLEKNYGIRFFYKDEWVKSGEVTVKFTDQPLVQVLNQVFTGKELTYKLFMNYGVIIYPQNAFNKSSTGFDGPQVLIVGNPINQGRYSKAKMQGRIVDGKSEEPLTGAVVYNTETGNATTTDSKGKYALDLPTGDLHLRISFLGYESLNQNIRLIENGNGDFELFEQSHSIGEITVVGEDSKTTKAQMSMIKMSSVTLKELPVLMGEADLIKSIVMMPGVQSTGEMSSGFNVRGGNTDQNLVLLDGAPVFNVTHMFGFFSMINPDAVKNITLLKGGIPAIYGERISSVMDVQMKEGQLDHLGINGGVGLINSRLTLEGPFAKKKKSSFLIGGRSTYSDWLLRQTRNPTFSHSVAHFYDVNGTANIEFGPKNHLKLMGYASSDVFNLNSNALYNYDNKLASLNWKLNLSKKLFSNLGLAYSRYDLRMDQKDETQTVNDYILKSNIQYASVKYDLSYYPTDKHQINGGFQLIGYKIDPGQVFPGQEISNVVHQEMRKEQSAEMALFADDDFELSDKLGFNIGLRYSKFNNYGPGMVYTYTPDVPRSRSTIKDSTSYSSGQLIKSYSGLEPRFAMKFNLENGGSVRLSYQRIHQFINQISNTAVITPADYWKSSTQGVLPLISDQVAIGFFKSPEKSKFETSVEVYYKFLQNLLEYKNGAVLQMNNYIESDLLMARGYAYGLEFLLRKNEGKMNGWISYTYSRTFRKTDNRFAEETINAGKSFPSMYDKPHDLSAVMNYKLSRRWRFSANFLFSSGRPITLPEEKYIFANHQVVSYSERNKYRMPPYHRMDVSLTFDENLKVKRMWKGSWTFSVYNLYGRKNPYSIFYKKGPADIETGITGYALYKLSIIGVPVPTITYNFKF